MVALGGKCPYCGCLIEVGRLACPAHRDLIALDHEEGFASGAMDETDIPDDLWQSVDGVAQC